MRTCVMPSADCSHLSRAEPALMVTLCSPPHPALLWLLEGGPLNSLRSLGSFLPAHFHTRGYGALQRIGIRLLAVKMEQEWVLG